MKLNELATKKGTYVGAKPSEESKTHLTKLQKDINVPNPIPVSKMHVTLIYSRKYLPDFKPRGKLKEVIKTTPTKLDIFKSKEGVNVLVVILESEALTNRHNHIMDTHEATYDYDEYKPHLTLSYDCGDFDVNEHDITKLLETITFDEEYDEELNTNWAKTNT